MIRFDSLSADCTGVVTDFNIELSQLVTPNIVDPLCVEVVENADGSVASVGFCSDVSLLFNQSRLDNALGKDGVKKFFDTLASRSSSFSELRKKCSDDDLAALCKSRYLQAPSEILAWSQYLNDNYKSLVSDVLSRNQY